MKRIFRWMKAQLNYAFLSERRFRRVARRRLQRRYYSAEASRATNTRKQVIIMFDGRKNHGGLADRLRGICTTYCFCREQGLDFRLHFVSPFRLEEFLVPNEYDWRIAPSELSYHIDDACPIYIASQDFDEERDNRFQRRVARRFFSADYKQLHLYTNMRFEEAHFGKTFHHLFRPTDALQRMVDEQVQRLGGSGRFVAVSTRFMELLGDFNESAERPAEALPVAEQEQLLAACGRQVEAIHARHPEAALLVTSDSNRFLDYLTARYDYVCTLPGKIGHMDVVGGADMAVHTKTFLDFLVLAEAAEHYYLVGKGMYRGNFSRRAAQIGEAPFHEVYF